MKQANKQNIRVSYIAGFFLTYKKIVKRAKGMKEIHDEERNAKEKFFDVKPPSTKKKRF